MLKSIVISPKESIDTGADLLEKGKDQVEISSRTENGQSDVQNPITIAPCENLTASEDCVEVKHLDLVGQESQPVDAKKPAILIEEDQKVLTPMKGENDLPYFLEEIEKGEPFHQVIPNIDRSETESPILSSNESVPSLSVEHILFQREKDGQSLHLGLTSRRDGNNS